MNISNSEIMEDRGFCMNGSYTFLLNYLLLKCGQGEIYDSLIKSCIDCQNGKYSFLYGERNCFLCPKEAHSCHKNEINLKFGYYIISYIPLNIYNCYPYEQSCM